MLPLLRCTKLLIGNPNGDLSLRFNSYQQSKVFTIIDFSYIFKHVTIRFSTLTVVGPQSFLHVFDTSV
jgi:hypothetical protein